MTTLPKNLQLTFSRLASYKKNTQKLMAVNQAAVTDGGTLVFNIPYGGTIDLHSLNLMAEFTTWTTDASNATVAAAVSGPPDSLGSLIDRFEIVINGYTIGSGLSYADVHKLHDNLTVADYMRRQLALYELFAPTSAADLDTRTSSTITLNKFLCPLLSASHFRFLPTSIIGGIQLRLILASSRRITVPNNTQTGHFQLQNPQLVYEVISFGGGLYEQMLQQKLAADGSILLPFTEYRTFLSPAGSTSSINTPSLDFLFALLRDPTYMGQATPLTGHGGINTWCKFSSFGNNTRFQWMIGPTAYPLFASSPDENWVLLKNALNASAQNQLFTPSIVDKADWLDYKHVFAQSFQHTTDHGETIQSGMNLGGLAYPIILRIANANAPHSAMIVAQCTAGLLVQPNTMSSYIP
eukprot:jgi/Chrzof1/14276/Cz08g31280.t1